MEEEMAPHSSILAGIIPWTGAWCAAVHGVTESDVTEKLHACTEPGQRHCGEREIRLRTWTWVSA